jgi:ribose/xylose/arabinose/galactoside ABC-type transport system permease subunit
MLHRMKRFAFVVYVLFGALAAIVGVIALGALMFGQWLVGIGAAVAAGILWVMSRSVGNPYRQSA